MRSALLLGLLWLVGCSAPPPPAATPSPTPTPEPTPTPTPSLAVETLDVFVGETRVFVRVVGPQAGVDRTQAALADARKELARVAALTEGPELDAAVAGAKEVARKLGARIKVTTEQVQAAYAVDRAAAKLERAGMSDFYVDAGDVVRARGSQDAALSRGWHTTVSDAEGEPIGTARLRGQAISQEPGASVPCTAVAGSAVVAYGARRALQKTKRISDAPGLALRVGLPGDERQNPAFQALLTPVGAGY